MREILLKRLQQIKFSQAGFNRNLKPWNIPISHGTLNEFADSMDFSKLEDEDLLFMFERIVRRLGTN